MFLPPLDDLAYPLDDHGDHPGGGHCAALGGDRPEQDRIAIVDQYRTALIVLVDAALNSGNGWSLSRPILFTVHQLSELALDVALERTGAKPTLSGKSRHSLAIRLRAALENGAYDHLSSDERAWCQLVIDRIVPITGNGFPGRYANARLDGAELDEVWCCINPGAIRDAAITFAEFSVIDLREPDQAEEIAIV